MAALLLTLVFVGLVAAGSQSSEDASDYGSPLADRMERMEKLLLQQDQRIQLLTTKTSLLESENEKLKDRLAFFDARQERKIRKGHRGSYSKKKGKGLLETSEAVIGGMVTRDVFTRSDDAPPLEPVVTQMGQKLNEVDAEVQALKNSFTTVQEAGTSVYVRWGSSRCPNSTQLVYSGVVGGSYFNHAGAATNYLCLTLSPNLSDHPVPVVYATLYGGEYQTYDSKMEKDPVCAVCRSQHPTTIMVPGTDACLPGWNLEYSGFLMAGHYGHVGGSEFVCVDSSLESRNAGFTDENGRLMYYTVTVCGSLPCDPYTNHKVVTCAVCSK